MYISKEGREIKKSYIEQATQQWKKLPLDGEVKIEVHLFFHNKLRRDIDNWHKPLLDSMTGIVWNDDSQITYMLVTKNMAKDSPRIEVVILE
jgi:crossover junction endodeoxyribonuclease RusA